MVATDLVNDFFSDAQQSYEEAISRLEAGDIRDAAEKAWGATLRATNALILHHTGEEPLKAPETSRLLDDVVTRIPDAKAIVGRYYSRQSRLHGDCFYLGLPATPDTERRIRETARYIEDARRLAANSPDS